MKHKIKAQCYVRYGDDFAIFSENRAWLESLIPHIRDFLHKRLRLELHPRKISLTTIASGVDFLGWVHFPDHRILRRATRRRIMRRIEFAPFGAIESYRGLLRHGNAVKLEKQFLNYYHLLVANG